MSEVPLYDSWSEKLRTSKRRSGARVKRSKNVSGPLVCYRVEGTGYRVKGLRCRGEGTGHGVFYFMTCAVPTHENRKF